MKPCSVLFVWILLGTTLHAQPAESRKGFQPLVAALHVHSRYSDGEYEIADLGLQAHARKIDVLGLTDSFLTRVRYGVGPFKKLVSKTMDRRSVRDLGLDKYLDSVEDTQKRFDDVVIVPGLEVAPYYYWKGSWPSDLELHDFDRHMLVFGIANREALRNLPVIENATWSNTPHQWIQAAGPALVVLMSFLVAAIAIAAGKRRAYFILSGLILVAGCVWTYDAFPFGQLSDPYSGKQDVQPFQRLIDYVDAHGGLSYWSYPEARYPDIQTPGARMVSRGQPEILGLTDRYQGFEGVYGDTITITKPGKLWDQILMDYIKNGRKTWPSVITGIDFHSFKPNNGWAQLDQGVTILFAKEKTLSAVLEAMKLGRGYATVEKDPAHRVGLQNFALTAGGAVAISGETLKAGSAVDFTTTVDWMAGDRQLSAAIADIKLVRDGELLEEYHSTLPAVIQRNENLKAGGHYYRIIVEYDGTQILSNPVFCEVQSN